MIPLTLETLKKISVGARGSRLSRAQVQEVQDAINAFHPEVQLMPHWIETTGDRERDRSLRDMPHSDFFTKEIDTLQLEGALRLAIHSAKDLPVPLTQGLKMIALTRGQDPSDYLAIAQGYCLATLPKGARIAASSRRREEAVLALRSDVAVVDIRGPIDERLQKLTRGDIQGLVVARAALIRLRCAEINGMPLDCPVAAFQGQLAIVSRADDEEMDALFSCLDVRRRLRGHGA